MLSKKSTLAAVAVLLLSNASGIFANENSSTEDVLKKVKHIVAVDEVVRSQDQLSDDEEETEQDEQTEELSE